MLLVDKDEVLCDFIGAAVGLHGYSREAFEAKRGVGGPWDCTTALGITDEEFWKPIHALGEEFWLELRPLPWMNDLVRLLNRVSSTAPWLIVTSPSRHIGSYTGKLKWIDRYLPSQLQFSWINQHKALLAKTGRWLIDDRQDNIHDFRDEGGHGILFPSYGNKLHQYATDPVTYLERIFIEKGLLK